MVDVVLQNAWVFHHINNDECDESLPLLACNFSEIFKGEQIILEPFRNSECLLSDVCYEVSHQMSVMRWHIIRCHRKNKACIKCTKIASDAAV